MKPVSIVKLWILSLPVVFWLGYLLCGCGEKPQTYMHRTNFWVHGSNMITIESTNGYVLNGLIVVTNLRPSSNYTVAMYSNDIRAVTNGTLADRITDLACMMFDKGFDAGFQCGKSGGNETNAAMIKAWHRGFIHSLDKLTP